MNRRHLVLALWIATAVFPFGWLTVFSREYARAFNAIFEPEAAHIVMHVFVFFGLACLLAFASGSRVLAGWRLLALWAVVCAVALVQEAVQLWYKRRAWGAAESFDLLTDFAGALLGLLFARLITHWHASRKRALL